MSWCPDTIYPKRCSFSACSDASPSPFSPSFLPLPLLGPVLRPLIQSLPLFFLSLFLPVYLCVCRLVLLSLLIAIITAIGCSLLTFLKPFGFLLVCLLYSAASFPASIFCLFCPSVLWFLFFVLCLFLVFSFGSLLKRKKYEA